MSVLQIELPDEELQILSEEARAHGYTDNAEYVRSLLRERRSQPKSYSVEDNPSPEQLVREERLLLEAANSPRTESTPELWAQLRAELGSRGGETG